MGEVQCVGLLPAREEDRFVLEPLLRLRVVEGYTTSARSLCLLRADTRWRCAGDLTNGDLAGLAVGERVVRLAGDGPTGGRVVGLADGKLQLLTGDRQIIVEASDYTLAAGSALVSRWRGDRALKQLNVASGVLTSAGKRNSYAIKDRFSAARAMLAEMGGVLALPGGAGTMTVSAEPVEVRMDDG
jgi:hypothetical protein